MRRLVYDAAKLAVAVATVAAGAAVATPTAAVAASPGATTGPAATTARAHADTLTRSQLADVRSRQRSMAADSTVAPTLATTAKTFTVNTTEDSDLANPAGTTCVDAASSKCSLRAAVDAANNLKKPVQIVLGKHDYTLTSGVSLSVTNPAGTSIKGQGSGYTAIQGVSSGIISAAPPSASDPAPLLFLSRLTLTGGTGTNGAALYLGYSDAGATAVVDRVVMEDNTGSSYGGAIYTDDYDTLYLTNSVIRNNNAPEGGGIYTYWSDVQIVDTRIVGNTTTAGNYGYGGGYYNEYGVVEMVRGSISGNTAGDGSYSGYGGGLYDEDGMFSATGVTIDHNTATVGGEGGGVYSYYDLLTISGGSISHDTVSGSDGTGGGLYEDYGSQVSLKNVEMAGDRVAGTVSNYEYGGGAIYMYGDEYANSLTVDGASITGANNSAIYIYVDYGQADVKITNSQIRNNTDAASNGYSAGCGGAICAVNYEYGGLNLDMSHNTFVNNVATGDYGTGAVAVYSIYYCGTSVHSSHDVFSSNRAGDDGYGGALYLYDYDDYSPITLTTTSDRFVGNVAGTSSYHGYGGAVALYYYATWADNGSSFLQNHVHGSDGYGGAVYNESYQSASFTGSRFIGNTVDASSGYGGAMYSDSESGDLFTGVTISGNVARYGGGYYAGNYGYEAKFLRSTVSGNTAGSSTAEGYGGGIYGDDSVISLTNTTVAGNTARSITGSPGQGGGIWNYGSTLGLRYSTVSGNIARQGAGIYLESSGTLLASIVSANKTSATGSERDCDHSSSAYQLHSLGGNVLGRSNCVTAVAPSDRVTTKPGLGKLGNNGGPTQTMRLVGSSPAIDRGGYDCPSTDQRGQRRSASACDAGAYERAPGSVTSLKPTKGTAGTKVVIKGHGFTFARVVSFGGAKAKFHVVSDSKITARAPKHSAGDVNVLVKTPDGAGKKGTFHYTG